MRITTIPMSAIWAVCLCGPTVAVAQDSGNLETVIVTAEKYSQDLQKTSIDLAVVSGEALVKAGISNPKDLTMLVPGLSIGGNGAFTQIYIRGVGDRSFNARSDPAIGVYVDGGVVSRPTSVGFNFFDVERLEVLKGPVGTLYGRNTTGGLMNIITRKPSDKFGGYVTLEAGDYSLFQATGALNVPILDTLAVRGAFKTISRDGYLSEGEDDDKQWAGRVHVLWTPSDDFSLLLTGTGAHMRGIGNGMVLTSNPCGRPGTGLPCAKARDSVGNDVVDALRWANRLPAAGNPGQPAFPIPGYGIFTDKDNWVVSGELNWNFGLANLTVLPLYRYEELTNAAYSGTMLDNNPAIDRTRTLEVRLANEYGWGKWVLGGFYLNQRQSNRSFVSSTSATGATTYGDPRNYATQETSTSAAFGQTTINVLPTLRLTAGLRWTHERNAGTGRSQTCSGPSADPFSSIVGPECPNPDLVMLPINANTPPGSSVSFNNLSVKAGVDYDLAPDHMVYANYSTGFKAGQMITITNTTKPEHLKAFEIGSKNRFFDDKLQLNVGAFWWEYTDQVFSYTTLDPFAAPPPALQTTNRAFNIGNGINKGIFADLTYRLTHHDRLRAYAEYSHSKYGSFVYTNSAAAANIKGPANTGCDVGPTYTLTNPITGGSAPVQDIDCTGREMILAPKWTGTASYEHVFELGTTGGALAAEASMSFSSKRWSNLDYVEDGELLPSWAVWNLDLTYFSPSEKYTLAAYVHNLTDELIYTASQAIPNTAGPTVTATSGTLMTVGTLAAPRTYGIRASFNF